MRMWLREHAQRHNNLLVVIPSTPAQYFHSLRRQVLSTFQKPLVLLTPKSIMHHRPCKSDIKEFGPDTWFQPVLGHEHTKHDVPPLDVRRVLICSGQVYFTLRRARFATKAWVGGPPITAVAACCFQNRRCLTMCRVDAAVASRHVQDVAIVRVEELSPFPFDHLATATIRAFPNAELVWVQEEPQNMGCWPYVEKRIQTMVRVLGRGSHARAASNTATHVHSGAPAVRYVGRPVAACATGSFHVHTTETRDRVVRPAFKK